MMFNLSSPTALACSAIATFSTMSSMYPLHTNAFSPSVVRKQGQAIGRRLNTIKSLSFAAVPVPVMKIDDEAGTSIAPSTSTGTGADAELDETVQATALAKLFVSSPNGLSGVMAIKLREGEYHNATATSTSTIIDTPKIEGDQALISQTGMFGGSINTNSVKKQSSEVQDMVGKSIQFSNGGTGTIIAQRPPIAFVLCDFAEWDESKISSSGDDEGENIDIISILNRKTSISVGDHLLGNIVDCYGHNAEIIRSDDNVVQRAIFAPIPQIKDIALINSPLLTGTAMVDALAPIGKGQNMLVIGQESGVGQRDLLIGTIKTQLTNTNAHAGKGVVCVYASTTQDEKIREEVLQQLKDDNLLNDIIVVAARDHGINDNNDKNNAIASSEAIAVASAACSIAETIALSRGADTFVVVDDIDEMKSFWDWTTRVLVDIYGVDAVVKDDLNGGASSEMRGFYSSLIQRAARFNKKNGGGSVTLTLLTNLEGEFGNDTENTSVFSREDFAESSEKIKQRIAIVADKGISLTAETLRKMQIPLPDASDSEKKRRLALQHIDDLVSMSDGQIWFDEKLYASGQRPAIDPQRSITRIGIGADTPCRADAPAMRGLVGGLRFDFAQASSLEGAGANSGVEKQILKRDSYLLAMHQDSDEVRTLSENCVALLASSLGVLNKTIELGGSAGTELGSEKIQSLLKHVWQSSPSVMKEIDQTFDISESARSELETIINDFFLLK